jgi:exonuclease V gamma subunit
VPGAIAIDRELGSTRHFAAVVDERAPDTLGRRSFVLMRGPFRLSGSLDGLYARGRFDARLAKLKSREMLRAWLAHLVMQLSDSALVSTVVCTDAVATFGPVDAPGQVLDDLLNLYWQCLSEPTPLIPEISLGYVSEGANDRAREKMRKAFLGHTRQTFVRAEARSHRTVYGSPVTDLPPGFEVLARRLWEPVTLFSTRAPLPRSVMLSEDQSQSKQGEHA